MPVRSSRTRRRTFAAGRHEDGARLRGRQFCVAAECPSPSKRIESPRFPGMVSDMKYCPKASACSTRWPRGYVSVTAVPVLETARLLLRPHRSDDFQACAAMWADPAVVRFISGTPFTPAQTWSKMLRYLGLWQLVGFGYWAIEERSTNRFVGELGFADFKRDMPSIDGLPELGWAIVAAAQHNGYATEAVHAATHWGDGHLHGRPTACIIDPGNVASVRVADRAGYREYARAGSAGAPLLVLRRPAVA